MLVTGPTEIHFDNLLSAYTMILRTNQLITDLTPPFPRI